MIFELTTEKKVCLCSLEISIDFNMQILDKVTTPTQKKEEKKTTPKTTTKKTHTRRIFKSNL